MCPRIILELEHRDIAIRGSACEEATSFVWCPCDEVDGCGVEGYVVDFLPGAGLFAPDDDFPVIRGGCQDVAVLGMCPCYAPDCAFMPVSQSIWCVCCSDGR